jgi:nucleoside-diphosphate-sugar epimerase
VRTLVTGCSGTLGAATANALARAGHTVLALVHRQALPPTVSAGVVAIPGTMSSIEELAGKLEGIAAVVHCAFDWRRSPAGHYERANLDGTLTLFRVAAGLGARRFVQVSSVMAYGLAIDRAAQPVDESAPLVAPSAALDRYAAVKAALEDRLARASREAGCGVVAVRPGLIFTEERLPEVRVVGRGARRLALVAGTGCNHLPYIHAGDVASLIVRVVEAERPAPAYNATPSVRVPTAAVARAWMRRRGARPIVIPMRTLPIEAAVVASSIARAVRQRRWQAPNLRYGRTRINRDIAYSNARARADLGWDDAMTTGMLGGQNA